MRVLSVVLVCGLLVLGHCHETSYTWEVKEAIIKPDWCVLPCLSRLWRICLSRLCFRVSCALCVCVRCVGVWGYSVEKVGITINGQFPGPTIRVIAGSHVTISGVWRVCLVCLVCMVCVVLVCGAATCTVTNKMVDKGMQKPFVR